MGDKRNRLAICVHFLQRHNGRGMSENSRRYSRLIEVNKHSDEKEKKIPVRVRKHRKGYRFAAKELADKLTVGISISSNSTRIAIILIGATERISAKRRCCRTVLRPIAPAVTRAKRLRSSADKSARVAEAESSGNGAQRSTIILFSTARCWRYEEIIPRRIVGREKSGVFFFFCI